MCGWVSSCAPAESIADPLELVYMCVLWCGRPLSGWGPENPLKSVVPPYPNGTLGVQPPSPLGTGKTGRFAGRCVCVGGVVASKDS